MTWFNKLVVGGACVALAALTVEPLTSFDGMREISDTEASGLIGGAIAAKCIDIYKVRCLGLDDDPWHRNCPIGSCWVKDEPPDGTDYVKKRGKIVKYGHCNHSNKYCGKRFKKKKCSSAPKPVDPVESGVPDPEEPLSV